MGYDWLNATQIVYVGSDHGTSKVCVLDIKGQTSKMLQTPTQELKDAQVEIRGGSDVKLSPNREWLSFAGYHESNAAVYALNLRQPGLIRTSLRPHTGEVAWLPDSLGLIQFGSGLKSCEARVFDVKKRTITKELRLPLRVGNPVVLQGRETCVLTFPKRTSNTLEISRIKLWPEVAALETKSIPWDKDGFEDNPAASADGRKFVWVQRSMERIPRVALDSWFPFVRLYRRTQSAIYIADMATDRIHGLKGSVRVSDYGELKWTPDGMGLSFVSNQTLYLIKNEVPRMKGLDH